MTRTVVLLAGLLSMVCIVAGCGGAGGPEDNPPTGETVSVGSLQANVDSAAAVKTVSLSSPVSSHIAFTALYGSRIVRLEEMGYTRIAFGSDRDGDYEIYTIDSDGTNLQKLTNNGRNDEYPAWSPDGTKIAFQRQISGSPDIFVMNADGTGATNLTAAAGSDRWPTWSPDGQWIAYSGDGTPAMNLWVMRPDGSGKRQLTSLSQGVAYPAWSPDGRQIAFQADLNVAAEIMVVNADGSAGKALTSNSDADWGPEWSPDGRLITFASNRAGPMQLYTMTVDGANVTPLPGLWSYFCSWCPDGRRLAVERSTDSDDEIFVTTPDGTEVLNLTNDGDDDEAPAWCPVPSVRRTLVGPASSDGGTNPPFGAEAPLAVVGLDADGLASALTVGLNASNWPTLKVSALANTGADLVGVKVIGSNLRNVVEDLGRGRGTHNWPVAGSPTTGAVLIFLAAETGKVSSVLATADTALSEAPAALKGGRVIVHGNFIGAYSADDPERNLVPLSGATEVALSHRTGEVVAVK